jgi:hypothetical protein
MFVGSVSGINTTRLMFVVPLSSNVISGTSVIDAANGATTFTRNVFVVDNCPSVALTLIVVLAGLVPLGTNVRVRSKPVPDSVTVPAEGSELVNPTVTGLPSTSTTWKLIVNVRLAGTAVPEAGNPRMSGASFTGETVAVKDLLAVFTPSDTVTVTVSCPEAFGCGMTVRTRSFPVPLTATTVTGDAPPTPTEEAETWRLPPAVSPSSTRKAMLVLTSSGIRTSGRKLSVGAVV